MRIVFCIYLLFFAAFCVHSGSRLFAQISFRPEDPADLGFVFEDRAHRVEVELVFADFNLIREDFPALSTASDAEIRLLFEQSVGVVSDLQKSLESILVSKLNQQEVDANPIYSPSGYRRSGLRKLISSQEKPLGLLDVKGLGLSPESFFVNRTSYVIIQLADPNVFFKKEFGQRAVAYLTAARDRVQKNIDQDEESLRKLGDSEHDQASIRLVLHRKETSENLLTIFKLLLHAAKLSPDKRSSFHHETLLEAVRKTDYMNGSMPLSRALKEAAAGVNFHRILSDYNKLTGSSYQSVRPYAVLAFKHDILYPNGQRKRAGLLVRQASYRFGFETDGVELPSQFFTRGVGRFQTDIFGRSLDHELPEILDSRLKDLFVLHGLGLRMQVDALFEKAVQEWEAGKRRALTRAFRKATNPTRRALRMSPQEIEQAKNTNQNLIKNEDLQDLSKHIGFAKEGDPEPLFRQLKLVLQNEVLGVGLVTYALVQVSEDHPVLVKRFLKKIILNGNFGEDLANWGPVIAVVSGLRANGKMLDAHEIISFLKKVKPDFYTFFALYIQGASQYFRDQQRDHHEGSSGQYEADIHHFVTALESMKNELFLSGLRHISEQLGSLESIESQEKELVLILRQQVVRYLRLGGRIKEIEKIVGLMPKDLQLWLKEFECRQALRGLGEEPSD